jgi:hypothetical protein
MSRQKTEDAESVPTNGKSAPLILDLIGPFVVHFQQGKEKQGTAWIYAPMCEDHHANVLTDSDDTSLNGLSAPPPTTGYSAGYVYEFEDSTAPSGVGRYKCDEDESKQLLVVQSGLDLVSETKCHLVLKVPCPDEIVPLHPEAIWIHRNKAKAWVIDHDADDKDIVSTKRARGLRFIYQKCSKEPKIRVKKEPKNVTGPDFEYFNAKTLGFPVEQSPAHYNITVRFAAAHTTSDGHEDAYNCFRTMRAIFPPPQFSKWRVDFDDVIINRQSAPDFVGGPNPRDCGAAILVLRNW